MKTKMLVALRSLYYAGDRRTGDQFEASEEHVQALLITGAAKLAEEDVKAKRYERRDIRADK